MMKRGRWWLAGGVALALIAGLLWFQHAERGAQARPTSAFASPTAAAGHGADRELAGDGPVSPDGQYFSLDAVTRASQLEGPEARRLLSEGDRLDMLFMAQMLCSADDAQRRWGKVKDMPAAQRSSWEFRIAFAKDFCDPALPDYTEVGARLAELDVHDDTAVAAGLNLLEGKDIEALGLPTASALIRNSQSVSAIKRASDFLLLSGRDLPQARALPMPASIGSSSQARMDAQRLAIDMLTCDLRGGCGARGLQTMAWCDRCGPSLTLQQVWERRYPPETMAYARALAARIAAERQQAAPP